MCVCVHVRISGCVYACVLVHVCVSACMVHTYMLRPAVNYGCHFSEYSPLFFFEIGSLTHLEVTK